jgi:hypothetical protein
LIASLRSGTGGLALFSSSESEEDEDDDDSRALDTSLFLSMTC